MSKVDLLYLVLFKTNKQTILPLPSLFMGPFNWEKKERFYFFSPLAERSSRRIVLFQGGMTWYELTFELFHIYIFSLYNSYSAHILKEENR